MTSITAVATMAQEEPPQNTGLPVVKEPTNPAEEAFTTYSEALRRELAANWTAGYSQMPDLVRQDRSLSPRAKIVYEQLLSYMWFKGDRCWPSQETIARATGYSRRTVIRACTELYERGYIEKWRRGQGYTNYYFLNPLTFPHSFKRQGREAAATMLLAADAQELRQDMTSSPPPSIDAALLRCQDVTSRSDKVAQPEVPGCHLNQTKEKQIQEKERSSNDSTSDKGTGVAGATIRNIQSSDEERTKTSTQAYSSKSNLQPNHQEHAAAARAKAVQAAEAEKQQSARAAAIAATTGIPAEHLRVLGVAQEEPQRRPTPEFITQIMTDYSRDLGDSQRSVKSNITRATKYYYLIYDYCPDQEFREAPEEYFTQLLYRSKEDSLNCVNIQYRNGNKPNRIPAFFGCLESRLNLTSEEREYLRSDAPLHYPGAEVC